MRDAVTEIKAAMEENALPLGIAMGEDAFRYGDQSRYWRIPCNSVKFRSQQERQWSNNDAAMEGSKTGRSRSEKKKPKQQYLECRIEVSCKSAMMRFGKRPKKTLTHGTALAVYGSEIETLRYCREYGP